MIEIFFGAGTRIAWVAVGAVSIGCMLAITIRKRIAIELMGWTMLLYLLAVLGQDYFNTWWFGWTVLGAVLGVAFVLAFIGRKRLFSPSEGKRTKLRDYAGAARLTLALLLLVEVVCRFVVLTSRPELIIWEISEVIEENTYKAGRPTIATLGSSPANQERVTERPFTVVLADRLGDRFNFLHYQKGGINSSVLFQNTRALLEDYPDIDVFILYVGFQDYNQPEIMRSQPLDSPIRRARAGVRWIMERSALVRMVLYAGIQAERQAQMDRMHSAAPDNADKVFAYYRQNVERIIQFAAERGIHVFAVTISNDRSVMSADAKRYTDMVNASIRNLPSEHDNVTLVEFASFLESKYPDGRLENCEPYEPDSGEGRQCGDPYHLGIRGHELLADVLEPALLAWRPR